MCIFMNIYYLLIFALIIHIYCTMTVKLFHLKCKNHLFILKSFSYSFFLRSLSCFPALKAIDSILALSFFSTSMFIALTIMLSQQNSRFLRTGNFYRDEKAVHFKRNRFLSSSVYSPRTLTRMIFSMAFNAASSTSLLVSIKV